jgi:Uma2 family endonuclease
MAPATMTAEELLLLDIPGKCTELVRGRLVVSEPPGFVRGVVVVKIARLISEFADSRGAGIVAADTGYTLERNPDTVRAPDVSFVRRERVPSPLPRGYAEFAPDLAVEVLSPGNRPGEVLAKIGDWLKAGTRLVWIVDPIRRSARVYRADGTEAFTAIDDSLDGEDVLPGFSLPLSAIL